MKKRLLICLSILCICFCGIGGVGCANSSNQNGGLAADLASKDYDYTYDRPFYSTPDDFMTIDGVFDEEEWQDCVWMQTTQYDVTYKITTLFTQKGLYVAAYAEDPNIIFNGRNNFIKNSSFEIQIVKSNAQRYYGGRWYQHFMNDFMFHADSQTCRSYRERQFNGAVKCVGEPNSGETTSLSYEMFLGWDQMHYSEDELNPETGIPDSVKIWCQYMRIDKSNSADSRYISPFLMDYGQYDSYYSYGAKGIINRPDNGVLGSAIGGTTCTDKWTIDNSVKGGDISFNTNQTQHIWFTHDVDGNEISRPTSFIVDVQVNAANRYSSGQATFGIMTIHDMWNMVVYGVNMSSMIMNKQLVLQSIEGIDSMYWVGQQKMNRTVSQFTGTSLCLRLIKLDGYYYYFYKTPDQTEYTYLGYEYWYKNSGEVDVGLFTNCPTTITNYSVQNYTGKEDDLQAELKKTVYFVDASDVSGGEVTVSQSVLRHGDSLTITSLPDEGFVLNEFYINDEDRFTDYVNANGRLTIVPTEDIIIKAVFVRIPKDNLKKVTYMIVDGNENPVSNASYTITGSNALFTKTGTTSAKGQIATNLPTACEFELNGKTYSSDGNYTISLSKSTYISVSDTFTVTEDMDKTLKMNLTLWGRKPSVNGKTVSNTYGVLLYDNSKDCYYVHASGAVREYYSNTAVNGNYIYDCEIKTNPINKGTITSVVGMIISSGTHSSAIVLKSASWETNRLCIEINGNEISINGFNHSLNNNNTDSKFVVKVVRLNNVLYIYDATDALVVTLDKNGVHPCGSRTYNNVAGLNYINNQLKEFFNNGSGNVCGPFLANSGNAHVEYYITAKTTGVEDFVKGGTIAISDTSIVCDTDLTSFKKGDVVTIYVKSTDANKAITKLNLKHSNGTKIIEGLFNPATGKTEFSFEHNLGSVEISKNAEMDIDTISGKISGITDYTKTSLYFKGALTGKYDGLVKVDGTFSFHAPKGKLAIAFVYGGYLSVVDEKETSALNNLTISMVKHTGMVGTAVVNGKTITSKATLDFDTYNTIAKNNGVKVTSDLASSEFGKAERIEYAALLTNSVTSNNFTLTDVTNGKCWGKFGVAITDGANILAIQFGTNGGGVENTLHISYGTWNEGGKFNIKKAVASKSGTNVGTTVSNATLKIVKDANSIKVYVGETLFVTVTNAEIGETFFKENTEYCSAVVSTMIAGAGITNKISIN